MPSTAPRKRDDEDVIALQILGARIRALRKHKLIAQDKLAHLAGIPRGHMTNVEAGRIDVKVTMLRRIARALDVHEHDLINPELEVERLPSRG
jgi:transcriptional regulator with XRE-family HTH domain